MAFYERQYDLYVLLGNAEAMPLWRWPEWYQAACILSPIIKAGRGKPAVRCSQYSVDGKQRISFGRLGWDEKSHQKWTHSSPSNGPESSGWRFRSLEVWSPSWTACEREKTAPDVFLCITNEAVAGGFSRILAFNPVVILAVSVDLTEETRGAARRSALKLASLVQAKLAVTKRRPWGRAVGGIGFTGAINDLGVTGLFKVGNRDQRPVDLATLNEAFELLNP